MNRAIGRLERVIGIEPTFTAWEAVVLPLDDTRERTDCNRGGPVWRGGQPDLTTARAPRPLIAGSLQRRTVL